MSESSATPLRFFELLRTLVAHDVEFIVIGGFALAFHGAPRATKDVDVVPAPRRENLTRLWEALAELEARPGELEGFCQEEMPLEWSLESLVAGGGNWILHTRKGRLDVMQWVEPFSDYGELRAGAVEQHVDEAGGTIMVAGIDDLIAMKEAAGRDQDLIDITSLRMARGLEE